MYNGSLSKSKGNHKQPKIFTLDNTKFVHSIWITRTHISYKRTSILNQLERLFASKNNTYNGSISKSTRYHKQPRSKLVYTKFEHHLD